MKGKRQEKRFSGNPHLSGNATASSSISNENDKYLNWNLSDFAVY